MNKKQPDQSRSSQQKPYRWLHKFGEDEAKIEEGLNNKRGKTMPTGTVKWFNNAKGYGFILPADSDEDVFAHYSAISMDGYRTLKAGQQVNFDLVDGEKGKHAANITVSDKSSVATCSEDEPEQEMSFETAGQGA